MIEQNDINDGTIIQGTTQRNDEKGNIKFLFTLPSGKIMCSEWIAPEKKQIALVRWLEAVRENIVGDLQDMRRAKIEASKPKTLHPLSDADQNMIRQMETAVVPAGTLGTSSRNSETQVTDNTDPILYAQSQVRQAERDRDNTFKQRMLAIATNNLAVSRLEMWRKVLTALGVQENESGEEIMRDPEGPALLEASGQGAEPVDPGA